ncbi:MAG: hypothetical protein IPM35_04670 [Myxococcales bacterium]|nr:hypothetical protein [Myxococcales bacterium]
MITTQQRRGALHMRALREVQAQLPREQYDRCFDLARGATSLVLAAAPQGAPDPAAHGIDAEALAKEFAAKYGLPIERARATVAGAGESELSTQAWATDAAESAKPKGGQENAADLSKAGGLGSLSVVATMRKITGDPEWGADLLGSASASAGAPKPAPKVLDLRTYAGRNVTERAMSAVREQSAGQRWSFDELHERACELIRLARAGGAEVLA